MEQAKSSKKPDPAKQKCPMDDAEEVESEYGEELE